MSAPLPCYFCDRMMLHCYECEENYCENRECEMSDAPGHDWMECRRGAEPETTTLTATEKNE